MPYHTDSTLLSWMTFFPLIGTGLIGVMLILKPLLRDSLSKKVQDSFSRFLALVCSAVSLVLAVMMWLAFDQNVTVTINDQVVPKLQMVHHLVWIKAFNIEYFIGVDGISVTMVMLTALISFIAVIASMPWGIAEDDHHHFSKRAVPGYMALLLMLESAMFGVFVAQDFFLFYVFWELMLLPMYFLIGIWGGPRKEYAAIKFFLYTLAGSVLMLLAMIALYFYSAGDYSLIDGSPAQYTFNLVKLAYLNDFAGAGLLLGMKFTHIVWIGLFIGFAIKIPMFPFHTWLPDAHVEAPTPISVILAGVLLKMGIYGILRINYTILPEATVWASTGMAVFGVINIVYAAFVCMAQRDLKKLIAYSSVSHMGFCLLGMASFTEQGIVGAVYQMWNHGLISAALFLIAGVIYDRAHHREINGFGGLAKVMPEYTAMMGLAFMASLGLPGLCGFISEALCFLGAFPVYTVLTVISATGVIITAAYYLWTIQRMFLGPVNEKYAKLPDMNWRERFVLYPLGAMIVLLGFYPMPIIDLMNSHLQLLVDPLQKAIGL